MARKQVLVQLDDRLLRSLDRFARKAKVSRSELIRRAAIAFLEEEDENLADIQFEESYRRYPETDWPPYPA